MSENVDLARRGYEAFRRQGVDGILEYLDPDIEWRAWDRFSREPNVVRGHQGVRGLFAVYEENFEDLRAEPLEFMEAGEDVVVVPFRLTGTERGTGEPVRIDLVHVWTTGAAGLATRVEVYESTADALRAVGLKRAE
jgi:ketosteroid isomerase-like protein